VIGLGRHGRHVCTAAALLGAANSGLAGVTSPLVGVLGVASAVPMGAMMGGTQLLAVLLLCWLVRPGLRSAA
jgi:DHA1 family bicyclomycin/chloramphenicol resistance-like MFS transporter